MWIDGALIPIVLSPGAQAQIRETAPPEPSLFHDTIYYYTSIS